MPVAWKGGELITRPLCFKGNQLGINFATLAARSTGVEFQDAGGKPMPGFKLEESAEVVGDEIDRTVAWKVDSNVGDPIGQPVRRRFVLTNADLDSLRFNEPR